MPARPKLDRLRAAAELLRPWVDPEERRRIERRTAEEAKALLEAIENGEPLPGRSYPRPPMSEAEQERHDAESAEINAYLDERREAIATAAQALREAGVENFLTRTAEKDGLLPRTDATGSLDDDEDDSGTT